MPPLKELLTERMHLMLAKSMRDDIERCRVKLGARSESDIVRRAVARFVAEELGDRPTPSASDASTGRYAGRTRVLVDTAPRAVEVSADREKRVGTPRPPERIRPGTPDFAPLDTTDIQPYTDMVDAHVAGLLGLDPDRIAPTPREAAPGPVCTECFCVAPRHSSVCSIASDPRTA